MNFHLPTFLLCITIPIATLTQPPVLSKQPKNIEMQQMSLSAHTKNTDDQYPYIPYTALGTDPVEDLNSAIPTASMRRRARFSHLVPGQPFLNLLRKCLPSCFEPEVDDSHNPD